MSSPPTSPRSPLSAGGTMPPSPSTPPFEHVEALSPSVSMSALSSTEVLPVQRPRPPFRRRSTLMLDDDDDYQTLHKEADPLDEGQLSRAEAGDQVDIGRTPQGAVDDKLVETVIEWKNGGNQVYVTGSFTGWRQMIPLHRFDEQTFGVVLRLAPGTHRLRFVVDGELRCSDQLPTATDSMGNLVNYMEVVDPGESEYTQFDENDVVAPPTLHYTSEIPEIFVDPEALDRLSSSDFTTPPQLPPHLDGVILNANWNEKDNNSVLPVPNHVVLNHLATTSIRHNVLAVASVSRYRAKFVTQILYSPL